MAADDDLHRIVNDPWFRAHLRRLCWQCGCFNREDVEDLFAVITSETVYRRTKRWASLDNNLRTNFATVAGWRVKDARSSILRQRRHEVPMEREGADGETFNVIDLQRPKNDPEDSELAWLVAEAAEWVCTDDELAVLRAVGTGDEIRRSTAFTTMWMVARRKVALALFLDGAVSHVDPQVRGDARAFHEVSHPPQWLTPWSYRQIIRYLKRRRDEDAA